MIFITETRNGNLSLVINFHKVDNHEWFEMVIKYLKEKYEIITANDLHNVFIHKRERKGLCHITVDDGDKSFYKIIFPVLYKYQVPASIYVSPLIITGNINFWFQEISEFNKNALLDIIAEKYKTDKIKLEKFNVGDIFTCLKIKEINEIIDKYKDSHNIGFTDRQNMNMEELIAIHKSGLVEVGAHTLNHPILANENDKTSESEILDSISNLKDILNSDIKYFAYPNGIPGLDFCKREIQYLRSANIKLAFSTECQKLKFNENNLLSIPRLGLSYGSKNIINLKLSAYKTWDFLRRHLLHNERKQRQDIYKLLMIN